MLTFATRFVLKVVVGKTPIRFDLKTECITVSKRLFGTLSAKHTCFTVENATPVGAVGEGAAPPKHQAFQLKRAKPWAFSSKGPNPRCMTSPRPPHQSVGR